MDSANASRLRVLIVNDDPVAADSLAVAVGIAGCEVRDAPGTADILAAIDEFMPHLLLVGISFASPRGREMKRRLRMLCRRDRPIVIATTGYAASNAAAGNHALAYDAQLPEPLDRDRLLHYLAACSNKLLPAE